MFKFNLKLIFRNLYKNKLYTFVNVVGLSVAIAVSLYTGLWVYHEYSYDRFHSEGEQIYYFQHEFVEDGKLATNYWSAPIFGESLPKDFKEVKESMRVAKTLSTVKAKTKVLQRINGIYADTHFFDFFGYQLLRGASEGVLKDVQSVVLSETLAEKLFGSKEKAMGQTIQLDFDKEFRVTGIMANTPVRSHMQFDFVMLLNIQGNRATNWGAEFLSSYFKIATPEEKDVLQAELKSYLIGKKAKTWKVSEEELEEEFAETTYMLTPLHSINHTDYLKSKSITFITIALLILALATANYVSMNISRSNLRAKEIGLRKVSGASKKSLITLFFVESSIISIGATLVSLVLLEGAIPFLNEVTSRDINLYQYNYLLIIGGILLGVSFISALGAVFPSYYLSTLKPLEVLHGNTLQIKKPLLQKGLVSFQIAVAVLLLTSSVLIYQQLDYVLHRDLGYKQDNILHLNFTSPYQYKEGEALKQELIRLPEIKHGVRTINEINDLGNSLGYRELENEKYVSYNTWGIQPDFNEVFDLEFVSKDPVLSRQQSGIIYVNEALMKDKKWGSIEDKYLVNWIDTFAVAGVVKNFSYKSSRNKINPLVIIARESDKGLMRDFEQIALRLEEGAVLLSTIEKIDGVWKKYFPNDPMNFTSISERIIAQHQDEFKFQNLILSYSIIAIVLALMGLFALSTYTVEQRTKEIGVRKVYGAEIKEIFTMLFWDFSKLVGVGSLVALPVAYYVMLQWLEQFAFSIPLSPFAFLLACLSIWLVASLTISYHSLKVAKADPVDALRDE